METQANQVALPLRSHTILGVCEALGEDFGFNASWLRAALAIGFLLNPPVIIGAYVGLAAVVLVSRWIYPKAKAAAPAATAATAPGADNDAAPAEFAEAA